MNTDQEIEKLAKEWYKNKHPQREVNQRSLNGFTAGYKAALQSNEEIIIPLQSKTLTKEATITKVEKFTPKIVLDEVSDVSAEQLFANNSDCYADTGRFEKCGSIATNVLPALRRAGNRITSLQNTYKR
jgi:hypothetical protein